MSILSNSHSSPGDCFDVGIYFHTNIAGWGFKSSALAVLGKGKRHPYFIGEHWLRSASDFYDQSP